MKMPKLPFRIPLPNLSEVFSFTRRDVMIISAVTGSVLIAAITIIIIVSIARSGTPAVGADTAEPVEDLQPGARQEAPFLSDFIILPDRMEDSFTGFVRSREPVDSWTRRWLIDTGSIPN